MNYINSMQTNIRVFNDTLDYINESVKLTEAVKDTVSRQFIWREGESFPEDSILIKRKVNTRIFTSKRRSLEAAGCYAGKKTAVLNFADNHTPGGAVVYGSNAQEECLCRCSNLYPCISDKRMMESFYLYHRNLFKEKQIDVFGNDDLIYSPGVVVIKTDTKIPRRLKEDSWYKTDIITCAAPVLNHMDISDEKEYSIHYRRFTHIMECASRMQVQVLILGAFGCGAFGNDPVIVSRAAHDALKQYDGAFETVEFAVFSTSRDRKNYKVFAKEFGTE